MFKFNFTKLFVFSFIILVASACSDPASSDDHDHHTDADGLALELNEVEVYRELEGAVLTNNLTLSVGDTLDLSVHFLDHDGDEIEHEDEEGEEDELASQITDSNIISILMEEHDDDHDEEEHHESGFELVGLTSGTTTFTISLMHNNHPDYTSLPISVTVAE